jgi:hypothetical protein
MVSQLMVTFVTHTERQQGINRFMASPSPSWSTFIPSISPYVFIQKLRNANVLVTAVQSTSRTNRCTVTWSNLHHMTTGADVQSRDITCTTCPLVRMYSHVI